MIDRRRVPTARIISARKLADTFITALSMQLDGRYRKVVGVEDFCAGNDEYDGLIYLEYRIDVDEVLSLYIRKYGRDGDDGRITRGGF